jgi:hypothetical protein
MNLSACWITPPVAAVDAVLVVGVLLVVVLAAVLAFNVVDVALGVAFTDVAACHVRVGDGEGAAPLPNSHSP